MTFYVCMFMLNILAIIFMYSILDSRYEKKTKEVQIEIYKEVVSRNAHIDSAINSLTDILNSINEVTKTDAEMIDTLENEVNSLTEELDYVHSQIDDINGLINKELASPFKVEIVNAFKNEAETVHDISKEDSTNEHDQ